MAAPSGRWVRTLIVLAVASTLASGILVELASADDLTVRRDRVEEQIAQTREDLNESTQELSAAAVAVEQAQSSLSAAQAELAAVRDDLAAAKRTDARMAAKLKKAKSALAKAKAAVRAGQRRLDAEHEMAGNMVRDQYQQQTNLLPIAILTESSSTSDLQTRLQWSTTMFDTTKAQIDRLTALQRELRARRARQAALEAQVARDRAAAANALRTTGSLEARAAQQEANVAALLQRSSAARAAAAVQVDSDKQRYADLNAERAAVEKRIAERIARAKAEAARKAAEERAAAERQAAAEARERAERRAAEQARSDAKKSPPRATKKKRSHAPRTSSKRRATTPRATPKRRSAPPRSPKRVSEPRNTTVSTSHGFSYPVYAPITSAYGMRLHPVLGYWKLHDGTDFGAGCGTPLRAPYSGRVSERYYSAGYGNRLMIDHGMVDGQFVTTGYNHAIRYTVGVGQRVSKGEVIGYVGTTGYSTGCHLHLMVWIDGGMRNPMTWF